MAEVKRIVHAHDQCAIAENLCEIGRSQGERWLRVPILPEHLVFPHSIGYGYGVVAEIAARSLAFLTSSTLHIHGGHLSEFCRRTSIDYVLHLHGSEIRGYRASGKPFLTVSPGTLAAMRKARKVVYSTPDLAPFVSPIRSDALWLPTPLDRSRIPQGRGESWFSDVFFPHAWNDSKGLENLRKVVQGIRKHSKRRLRFVGLKLGSRLEIARELGFELVQPSNRIEHIERMIKSKLVLGQGLGIVVATDLEALVHRANLLSFPLESNALGHYGLTAQNQPSPNLDSMINAAVKFFDDDEELPGQIGHRRILQYHNDTAIYERLLEIYST